VPECLRALCPCPATWQRPKSARSSTVAGPMAPKKAVPAPAGQPTIGAAFARKSGQHAVAGAAEAGASPAAAAAPPLVLVREQGGVAEYSDFAVNNLKDEGSKTTTKAPESDVVEAGACPARSRPAASAHLLLRAKVVQLAACRSRGVLLGLPLRSATSEGPWQRRTR